MKQGKLSELVQFPLSIYQLKVMQVNKARLAPREYLTLNVDDKAKPTVPSVCKPCFKNVGDFIRHLDSLKLKCL